jgi:mono/diheme cytochrome c family protein
MTAKHFFLPITICGALFTAQSASHAAAACGATTATAANAEIKLIIPFAVPVGVPVAPFAPYFYSYQAGQGREASGEARATVQGREARDEGRVEEYPSTATMTNAPPSPHAARLSPLERSSPLVAAHCAACHGGAAPKANVSFESIEQLSIDNRWKAIRAIVSGRMPKGEQLSPDEIRALIEELTETVDVGGDSRRRRTRSGLSAGAQSASGDASYKAEANHGVAEAQRGQ